MKSKLVIACVTALFMAVQARSEEPKSYTAVISTFISGHVNTDAKKLDNVLSDDATFKIPRQNKVIVQSRSALLNAMKQESGVVQNCSSSYQLITKTDALIMARVDFKYPGFVQQNFITMERSGDAGWKITQVYKISENAEKNAGSYPLVTAVD
ncbi:nuclear transport factor 2 family protein [Hufsiella ginkgonis]|uniref:Nuclear transport factor 2 family protein n=1 Tax=Hufsiella ginkgonis TaxID=2695274 RepID=A0A7K1Y1A6_9SPHI|nr:nuclear transport factor 2 family protein [Hufsiella ginkgonis]MXV17030.1 hypothetical protein [Hufsiella ginkgonis]